MRIIYYVNIAIDLIYDGLINQILSALCIKSILDFSIQTMCKPHMAN